MEGAVVFDIGFFELLVIAIVGLVIIGPERLPETARAVGLWLGRVKRSLRATRSEIEKQLGADDIRRQLHNEEVMRSLEATRRQIQDAVQEGVIEDRPKPQKRKTDQPAQPGETAQPAEPQDPDSKYRDEEELPDHAHGEETSPDGPNTHGKPASDQGDAERKQSPAGSTPRAEGSQPTDPRKSS